MANPLPGMGFSWRAVFSLPGSPESGSSSVADMVHWKTLLALCGVVVPLQVTALGWLIATEHRLTKIETIIENRLPARPGEGPTTESARRGRPRVAGENPRSH